MQNSKKSICIISFSPIYRDARVLRQIKYLHPFYHLTIIGYGKPHSELVNLPNIKWISIDHSSKPAKKMIYLKRWISLKNFLPDRFKNDLLIKFISPLIKPKSMIECLLLFSGRMYPRSYDAWFWRKKQHLQAFKYAVQSNCVAIHANDWEALPIAAKAAKTNQAKVVFDAHEYAPLELENRRYWKFLFRPAIIYFIKKYAPQVNATITVSSVISDRYQKEFGFNPIVILNAPEMEPLREKTLDFDNIRLVYHGGAIRDRRLESLIETLALCDRRFSLHFILLNNDPGYSKSLRELARKLAPGRVMFYEPVPPEQVVERISEYDIGFYLLEPNSFNNIAALPNKFFDYIVAGLALCIGPSPSMAEIVRQYGLGCVAPSFDPRYVAEVLNRLTANELLSMQAASREAAQKINAESELKKLVDLYDDLFVGIGCFAMSDDIHFQIPS